MTRRRKKYRRNFTLIIFVFFILAILSLVSTNQLKVTFAKDIASSNNGDVQINNLTYVNSEDTVAFDEPSLSNGKNVLLFSSNWCGSCDLLRREIKEVAQQNPKIKFYELDIDGFRDLANQLGVKTAPSVVFFENEEYKSINGIDLAALTANMDFFVSNIFENVGKI